MFSRSLEDGLTSIYHLIRFKSVGETDHISAFKETGDRCSWAASPGLKSCQGRMCKKVDGADFPAVFFHICNFDICHEIQLTNTNA